MGTPGSPEDLEPLTVTATSAHGVVWIVVSGEVDLANRDRLRTCLARIDLGRSSLVYLDLRLLGFCDSDGCRLLLRFEQQATAAGHDVRIYQPQPVVQKVLSILGGPR
jgi:anti-anti-sigma factor